MTRTSACSSRRAFYDDIRNVAGDVLREHRLAADAFALCLARTLASTFLPLARSVFPILRPASGRAGVVVTIRLPECGAAAAPERVAAHAQVA